MGKIDIFTVLSLPIHEQTMPFDVFLALLSRAFWHFQHTDTVHVSLNVYLSIYFSLLLFCSVVSDSLWLHGLQYARLPCPPLSPGVCSNSCPLSGLKEKQAHFPPTENLHKEESHKSASPATQNPFYSRVETKGPKRLIWVFCYFNPTEAHG